MHLALVEVLYCTKVLLMYGLGREIPHLCLAQWGLLWTIKDYRCGIKWRPEIEHFICSHRLHIWYKAGINVLWSWQCSWLGMEGVLECQMACVLIGPCSNWKSLVVRFLSVLVATLNSTPVPRKMFIFSKLALDFPLTKTDIIASINKQNGILEAEL